jgi:hypothetical protein
MTPEQPQVTAESVAVSATCRDPRGTGTPLKVASPLGARPLSITS